MWASWRRLQLIRGARELAGCNSNDIRLLKATSFWGEDGRVSGVSNFY
jgi:hypothetical protein